MSMLVLMFVLAYAHAVVLTFSLCCFGAYAYAYSCLCLFMLMLAGVFIRIRDSAWKVDPQIWSQSFNDILKMTILHFENDRLTC